MILSGKISIPMQAPKDLLVEQAQNWYRQRNFVVLPVILVTTVNKQGTPNASVKTNFMTVSSMRRYAFSCSPQHHTYQNIIETGQFVINVPTEDIVAKVLKAAMITEKPCPPHVNEIEEARLTPFPSEKVIPPGIKECIAHYECLLDWCKDNIIVGKVVAVSVDKTLIDGTDKRKPIVIGGQGLDGYTTVGKVKRWPNIST
jgi:flavin reductase (DIM6/NTAB) family NADH-FMN oxidoreductase RutF